MIQILNTLRLSKAFTIITRRNSVFGRFYVQKPLIKREELVKKANFQEIHRGFKVKTSTKLRCKDCYRVVRKGRVYIYCKTNGKHKQRQG